MRKIIVTEFYSLDGFMSDQKDEMDWVLSNFDPELGQYEDDLYDGADTLFLGRVTYKIFEGFWPSDAATSGDDAEMARKINNINKIVFSKTLDGVEWENSKLLKEINSEEILRMKESPGKNILVVGSSTIVQQMTNSGLIDEYHFVVHPVILGSGKPLFNDIEARHKLKLFDTKVFNNGVILLKYQPAESIPE